MSCEKDLDISEFSDDFNFYNPELRIEAVIYPTENSALVRIDHSVRIDEADLFDCIDDDDDWNYFYCTVNDSSFESLLECSDNCESMCQQHLYSCYNKECEIDCPLVTFTNKTSCQNSCQFECKTDDTGTDGFLTPENGGPLGFITPDEDGSENNGIPDCNEPNVDEYDEILPGIHVQDCDVKITHEAGNVCQFLFNENAGHFFDFAGNHHDDYEIVRYGGFTPDSTQCNLDFNLYETEYNIDVDCSAIPSYAYYGKIEAQTVVKKPVVIFPPEHYDSIIACSDSLTNSFQIYDCMELYQFNHNDTLNFIASPLSDELDSIIEYWEDILDTTLIYDGSDDEESVITYASLYETRKYQAVQYMYDDELEEYVFVHGHPEGGTDSGNNFFNNSICVMSEAVVAEPVEGEYRFKYVFYTFSEGYENYYFFDLLDLSDPERTNLRDQDGNPVMGGFGSMASRTVYFQVILPEWLDLDGF